jgi:nucleotide-binding universal stress UspA family protein
MVYVEADGKPEPRVRLSAGLADRFNATLIGMSALAIALPYVVDGVAREERPRSDIEEMRRRLADKGSWFRTIAGADRRTIEWRSVLDVPINAVPREARSADLVVMGGPKDDSDASYQGNGILALDPGTAILAMGRPTLVVPDGVGSLRAERVVIGWKDTREARRAVQDALPFLHEKIDVVIVELCGADEEERARAHMADVENYLLRHRIRSCVKITRHQEGSSAAQLIQLAREEHADLIVTGAYGHSRFGEWVFGGMTRDLLATSPICCLMSH